MSNQTIKRYGRTITKNNKSHQITIPSDLAKEWGLTRGQEAVMYHVAEMLLVVPLATLLREGEPKLLSRLAQALELPAP